jgi:hypothetical protein
MDAETIALTTQRQIRILRMANHTPTRVELSVDCFKALRDWWPTVVEPIGTVPPPDEQRIWGLPIRLVSGENVARTVSVEIWGLVEFDGHVPMRRVIADPVSETVSYERAN